MACWRSLGLGFGLPSLIVAGFGMVGLAAIAVVWVQLSLPRTLIRLPGPSRVIEGDPFALEVRAVGGYLPAARGRAHRLRARRAGPDRPALGTGGRRRR